MYKIYALLLVACTPSVMFSMDQSKADTEKSFFEAFKYPLQKSTVEYIKNQVRKNPDYVTVRHQGTRCSPLWVLVGSLIEAKVNNFRVEHVAGLYSAKTSKESDLVDLYQDLFLFFLNEGAEIDFTAAPESLDLSAEQVPQELRNEWRNFIWRKARKALVSGDGKELAAYLDKHPYLLSFPNTDTKTTLLDEAVSTLSEEKKEALGMFRLLLRKGADADVTNGDNVTVTALMSLDAVPLHSAATLFNYEATRTKPHEVKWGSVLPPEKIKGFFADMYGKALPYKEYIVGAGGLIFMSYLMFGGSSLERAPLDAQVLG